LPVVAWQRGSVVTPLLRDLAFPALVNSTQFFIQVCF
jgi:hypothetical protein